MAAVLSVEPSSTTRTSTPGRSSRTSRTTSPIHPDSFNAGMVTSTRLSSIIIRRHLDRVRSVLFLGAGPQQGQVLGDGPGLLLQPADLPAQVHADEEQEDDAEEEHQADRRGHTEKADHVVQ